MQQTLLTIGTLIGGLGLFLLAVRMITDGLRLAAGGALREMLGKWTGTPARGVRSGIIITALVQSSSAVTVATIGFVNAGLLTLYQALGVVYGANIGTTMTGWLVAVVGFKIQVEAFALPLVGIGMLLRLTGGRTRRGALGEALAGFGLFFIGIDVLKGAFEGMATAINLETLAAGPILGTLLFVLVGLMMTVLTQSSSAAIAITLTAATGGVLSLPAAAATVIGANVGTTSTAVLSVIGATPNAKRVAAAHVVFNGVTGLVALLLLPLMLWTVQLGGRALGLQDAPAVTLALFHTVFNVLGVLLLWPVTARLAAFLERRFRTEQEVEGQPRHLDATVAVTPTLAVSAIGLELARVAAIARRMGKAAVGDQRPSRVAEDLETVNSLVAAVGQFVSRLERVNLPAEISDLLPKALRTGRYFSAVAALSAESVQAQSELAPIGDEATAGSATRFRSAVIELFDASDVTGERFSFEELDARLQRVEALYQDLKNALLDAGANGRVDITEMAAHLEQNSHLRRLAEQMVKGAHHLATLGLPVDKAGMQSGQAVTTTPPEAV